ncbi:DinB family protein [Tenacibaculum sp. 190524A02b]|uniref:DinB family protein n=1 Tax=Tenacibaculum vairaonense TaxID=3137860 RepID=A0ABM9PIW6_9FLAO
MEIYNFNLTQSLEILRKTPKILEGLLKDISDFWTINNEGENSWNPTQVVKHLILADKTNWVPRINIILSNSKDKNYKPFERMDDSIKTDDINLLLKEFKEIRTESLITLKAKNINQSDLKKTGIHPVFGEVTLAQQISTWCVHDLSHISQICRVMAYQYREEVGPWSEYLSIIKKNN